MSEEQKPLLDEEPEREFAEAAQAFEDNTTNTEIEEGADITAEPKKEKTAEQNQQILEALGFKRYEDAGVVKYNIRVMGIKIGATFNETNPLGKLWAYKISEGDEEKEFLKNDELKKHPLILKYHAIQEDKEPLSEITVTGKILEKRGKAFKIEIVENGETKEIFFGQAAVKKDYDGYFIPAGFSKSGKDKEGKEHEAKMSVPRSIRLPDYLAQIKDAPVADATKEKEAPQLPRKPDDVAKTDLQPSEKGSLADVIGQLGGGQKKEPEATRQEGKNQPTEYTEAIAKYTNILAEITEAVVAEDRIPSREKGYAVKFIYHSVIEEKTKKLELRKSQI